MVVKKFVFEEHFNTINSWANERGKNIIPPLLSQNGFIVTENEQPLLTVFVYFFLDVPVVQLDYFLSKPGISFWKLKKAWKILFSFLKDFLNEIYLLGGGKYSLIKCNIDSRLGEHLCRTDKEWLLSAKDTSALAYII